MAECDRCKDVSVAGAIRGKKVAFFKNGLLVFTPKCNLPPNASAKFLSAKILLENSETSKSEIVKLQNDRI